MFRKMICMAIHAVSVQAGGSFDTESLVLTDAPCTIDLISHKAEATLKFSKDLDAALQRACLENKLVLVFIVGSNGCPWSEKLLFDVVFKPEFYKEAQKQFILAKIEIDNLTAMGQELGLEHPVDQIPMLLCLTKEGKMLAEQHNIPESPKDVLTYLKQVIDAQDKLDIALSKQSSLTDEEIEENYKLSRSLGLKTESIFYQLGTLKKKNIFFLLEKYQKLLLSGSTKEIKDLKLDIQRLDPRNLKGAIRSMAIMEFEERSRQKKGMDNPFSALKPLFEYLRDYGHYDKECRWEIEMRIARFLFSKNQLQAAIQHASRSLEWAPDAKKSEVGEAVDFLKKQKNTP